MGFHEEYPFLVMEYVPGLNLAQYAERERPSARKIAALMVQVAQALSVAHRRGVTHRDVKPENIVITEDGQPRLIDFGMAWLPCVDCWLSGRFRGQGS